MENEDIELSESGAPVLRHAARERPFEFAVGDSQSIEQISNHIEQWVGPIHAVWHEIVSDLVHIDIHVVAPSSERNYYTLITSGMSDRPMTVPAGIEEYRYAEMMVCLPPAWPLEQDKLKENRNYWPVEWLKILARLPFEYDTWIGVGHTIPKGDPPQPFADNTTLCCALVTPPTQFPDEFEALTISPEKTIHFLALVPIYKQEMDFKLKQGIEPLVDLFDAAGVSEILNVNRPSVVKKKLFGRY